MVVETYSHVLHIVSQVSGTLRDGIGAMDVLRAALPAGTLSGRAEGAGDADHRRARAAQALLLRRRDRLSELHGRPRHAIHIRTAVVKDGLVHVQAGGGTVADAKPDYEYRESVEKAQGDVPGGRARREPGGVGMIERRQPMRRPGDRQLRLASPTTSSSTWASSAPRSRSSATTRRRSRELLGRRPERLVISPGPCTPGGGRDLDRGLARVPRGRDPDARRLPRPPGDGRGVRRQHDPRRADPRQGRRDRARRRGPLRGPAEPARSPAATTR